MNSFKRFSAPCSPGLHSMSIESYQFLDGRRLRSEIDKSDLVSSSYSILFSEINGSHGGFSSTKHPLL